MACSARLPIYTLIIATTIPDVTWLGFIHLHGLILLGLYCLGIVGALLAAWFLRRTLIKSTPPLMVMELPAYRWPSARAIGRNVWERAWMFIVKAGTLILGINILLWFLVTYPHAPKPDASGSGNQSNAGEAIAQSYAGRLGKVIEPAIAPLGMDWRIGTAIISSFAAREVFISTLSIIYNVEDDKTHTHNQQALSLSLQQQKRPNGLDVYTPLLGLSILMFYVFAMQCVSTMVVVYRETNSWRWPVIQWLIMGAMAWISSFIVYQGGRLLGFS